MIGRVLRLAAEVSRHRVRRVLHGVLIFLVVPAGLLVVLYELLVRDEGTSRPIVALVAAILAELRYGGD